MDADTPEQEAVPSFADEDETPKPKPHKQKPAKQQAAAPASKKIPPSSIEQMYSARIVDELSQFGYDLFGVPSAETEKQINALNMQTPMGAVQDDFVLGIGDELEVTFSGQRTDRGTYKVTSQGLLLIQDFPPIPASGRTIVVPRDPEPFDFIESAKDISQILSNLAITAIFIDDVRDDD